ncbi:MAG: dTDP-glucose 4,6-dehydratase [Pseudomonadota bacterium]
MKYLITGGAGFIGSALVRAALDRGCAVVNFDKLTYAANPDNLKGWDDRPDYTFVRADVADAAAVADAFATHQPDAVIHLAAESHVDRSIDGPADFLCTNVVGTFTLLEEARRYYEALPGARKDAFRVLHVSTDEVYGSLGPEGRFTEETPYRPNSPYSASKAASDFFVRAWGETYALPVVTSNCSNNYGPYQFPEKLIPVVVLAGLEGAPIPIYGDGSNVRDWLYVEDHADALLLIAEKGALGRTYNVGGDAEMANIDLVRTICAALDRLAPAKTPYSDLIEYVEDRPGHDRRYAIDAARIRDELGWTPKTSLADGLERTVDWYLNNDWWWRACRARGHDGARLGLGK